MKSCAPCALNRTRGARSAANPLVQKPRAGSGMPIRADILSEVRIPVWRFLSRSWRHVAGTAALLVVCVGVIVASKGPCSAALLSWGRDEVVLVGAGNADAGHRDASVVLSVRNVAGLENGLYEV